MAIDRTLVSETDGARRDPQGASASRTLYNTWEAEVGSPHPSVRPGTILPSRPAPAPAGARSGGQGWPAFGPPPSAARSVLDGREHDGSIVRRRGPRSATRTEPAIKEVARRAIKKRAPAHSHSAMARIAFSSALARGPVISPLLGAAGQVDCPRPLIWAWPRFDRVLYAPMTHVELRTTRISRGSS
jgi:hypothetical protein